MPMPDPGSALHVASVDYQCTFSTLTDQGGKVTFFSDLVHFIFNFETGSTQTSPGVFEVTWDYSWFDQAAEEAGIAAALDPIVQAVAELLSLTIDQVDQAVAIRRVWAYAPNVQGPDVSSGRISASDYMQYPPLVSDADVSSGADGGEAVVPE